MAIEAVDPGAASGDGPAKVTGAAAQKAVREALAVVPVIITKVELWKIDRLLPLERNPRTHSDQQIDEIAASMKEFGFLWPIMVEGKSGRIVAGNGRYMAAVRLGLPVVPVVEERHLTAVQRRAFVIADNKIALNAGWSTEILAEELPALKDAGFDLGITGFSDDELAQILASVDDGSQGVEEPPLPPLPVKAVSRRGDLWLLGSHRVFCGDATVVGDVQAAMQTEPAEALWTDPPYGIDYEGAAGSFMNDGLPEEEFREFLRSAFASALSVMRPGAPAYICYAHLLAEISHLAFRDAGFKISSVLVWRKNVLSPSHGDYHWRHEAIIYGWKPGAPHRWYAPGNRTSVVEFEDPPFQQVGENEWQIVLGETTLIVRGEDLTIEPARGTVFFENKPSANPLHPTMKPVALIQRMLVNSTRQGDHVLDLFGGSGSTLIACEALGRRAHLVELDPRFVDVIVMRWEALTGKPARLAGAGTFDEVAEARAEEAEG